MTRRTPVRESLKERLKNLRLHGMARALDAELERSIFQWGMSLSG